MPQYIKHNVLFYPTAPTSNGTTKLFMPTRQGESSAPVVMNNRSPTRPVAFRTVHLGGLKHGSVFGR